MRSDRATKAKRCKRMKGVVERCVRIEGFWINGPSMRVRSRSDRTTKTKRCKRMKGVVERYVRIEGFWVNGPSIRVWLCSWVCFVVGGFFEVFSDVSVDGCGSKGAMTEEDLDCFKIHAVF